MYVAVIAESIADRKHLERLLDRVSDSIMNTAGNLYIESYGDVNSIGTMANRYSMFFLDFMTDASLMGAVMDKLLECGVTLDKIIICQSEEAAKNASAANTECLTVQKPLNMEQLTEVVLKIYQREQDAKVPTLEIRNEGETQYIPLDQVVYAEEEGHQVRIYLTGGEEFLMLGQIADFAREVDFSGDFITYKKGFSYNQAYEKSKSSSGITLTTGKTFTLSRFDKKLISS